MLDHVRSPTPPSLSSFTGPTRARSGNEPCPLSASGTIHEGLGSVAEASSRSSWPTLALHPRGGHCWLSASVSAPLTELEKFEKLPVRGTLGAMTSFKRLGPFTSPIDIHPRAIRCRTMIGHLRRRRRSHRMEILKKVWGTRAFPGILGNHEQSACLTQHRYREAACVLASGWVAQ